MSRFTPRPRRTKMYDCNFTMGESLYRPVIDGLDRPRGFRGPSAEVPAGRPLSVLLDEADLPPEERSGRSRPLSSLIDDADALIQERRNFAQRLREDRAEEMASREAINASRARVAALEEEIASTRSSKRQGHKAVEFAEKVLDSVGIRNDDIVQARKMLERDEQTSRRRELKMSTTAVAEEEGEGWTKWSKLGSGARELDKLAPMELTEDMGVSNAELRARKSRARLADIEQEMETLAQRAAAREKRVAQLRSLLQESEETQTVSVRQDKKTVTF